MFKFRRKLPAGRVYKARLAEELALIHKFKFSHVFEQVREILDLTPDIPHIARGSAGGSLVCYLLGISDFDPLEHGCSLARFMHDQRPDTPDVDIDFPYDRRDEVIDRVKRRFPGRVARISTKRRYRQSSAVRQALRDVGIRGFLPRGFDLRLVAGDRYQEVLSAAQQLLNRHRLDALHCGGLVIFDGPVPPDMKKTEGQIKLDKDETERAGLHKIDLLCNRGLAQWHHVSATRPLWDYPEYDQATARSFQTGDTMGVTFAESPAQRRLLRMLQPRCRADVVLALALIRPSPSADGRKAKVIQQWSRTRSTQGNLIYDEDGIALIQSLLHCSEGQAEVYRKAFAKKNQTLIREFTDKINHRPDCPAIVNGLSCYALYSFCKAHAVAYGHLVWALAYEKIRQPHEFWTGTLNHAASMYRPWVHVQEAKLAGLNFSNFGNGKWSLRGRTLHNTRPDNVQGDGWHQYAKRGYWISDRFLPGTFFDGKNFRGLIATGRHHTVAGRNLTFLTVGYATGKYLELTVKDLVPFDRWDGVTGTGFWQDDVLRVTKLDRWDVRRPI